MNRTYQSDTLGLRHSLNFESKHPTKNICFVRFLDNNAILIFMWGYLAVLDGQIQCVTRGKMTEVTPDQDAN